MLLMVLLLVMVVVMEWSRPRVVRRMVVWRRQALRWVGVMLEAKSVSGVEAHNGKSKMRCVQRCVKIWAGYKEQ